MVWLFERETGKPVYPINEMPVDTTTELMGEKVWPTQPIPTFIKPFVRQSISANDINPYLPDSTIRKLKKDMEGYRYGKMFLSPGKKTAVELPGFDGGAEWGGPSYDPQTGLLYVNANEMGWLVTMRDVQLKPVIDESYYEAGLRLYNKYCMTCHGAERKSKGDFPVLDNIQAKYNFTQIKELLSTGRRRMPSFNYITNEEKEAIISYLFKLNEEKKRFVRTAQPENLLGLIDRLNSPAYSTSVGLLQWALSMHDQDLSIGRERRGKGEKNMNLMKKIIGRILP